MGLQNATARRLGVPDLTTTVLTLTLTGLPLTQRWRAAESRPAPPPARHVHHVSRRRVGAFVIFHLASARFSRWRSPCSWQTASPPTDSRSSSRHGQWAPEPAIESARLGIDELQAQRGNTMETPGRRSKRSWTHIQRLVGGRGIGFLNKDRSMPTKATG